MKTAQCEPNGAAEGTLFELHTVSYRFFFGILYFLFWNSAQTQSAVSLENDF